LGLITVESAFRQYAISSVGARGLMQVMPDTARAMGYDPADMFEPAIAIDAGTRYLGMQLRTFGRVDLGLAAYNAGPRAVERYGGIPPYRETRNYVVKTVRQYAKNYLRSLQ
jgi:lytic transglycosylase, catalytic